MKNITIGLAALALVAIAAPAVHAKDYEAGDNPMCIKGPDGVIACLKASDTEVAAGDSVTFFARKTNFAPGTEVCLARSGKAYGTYTGLPACSTVTKRGTVEITAELGKKGASWYDFGDAACLALTPAKRPPSECGDDGGVQATPVKVTID